jgi:hypothetical protein
VFLCLSSPLLFQRIGYTGSHSGHGQITHFILDIILDFFCRLSTEVRAKLDDAAKQVEDEIDDDTTITSSEKLSNGRRCFNFICFNFIGREEFEGKNIKSEEELALEASEYLKEELGYKR